MNYPAASCGVSEKLNLSQGRHPRMFLSGVQSEHPSGFPLKACGNDGLREGASSTQQAAGVSKKLNLSQGRHPRMFLSGVQSEHPPGFPLQPKADQPQAEKACGNDGLWQSHQPPLRSISHRLISLWLKLRGINPLRLILLPQIARR